MQKLNLGVGELSPELDYFVNKAQAEAMTLGARAAGADASLPDVQQIVKRETRHLGIQVQRDRFAQASIAEKLADVMAEAQRLQYDIADSRMQGILVEIAVLMHTHGYTPMRVLGATVEGFGK